MKVTTWRGWPTVVSATIATGLLLLILSVQPGRELPMFLVQLDALVLTAGAAYLLDDVAKSVTDVVPRSLLRRRGVIVAQGLLVVAVGWSVMLAVCTWMSTSAPPVILSWEIAGLSCVAVAATAIVSLAGEAEPGNLVAPALALAFIATLIVQQMVDVPILATSSEGPANAGWWSVVIVIAVATFVIASGRSGRRLPDGRPRQLLD